MKLVNEEIYQKLKEKIEQELKTNTKTTLKTVLDSMTLKNQKVINPDYGINKLYIERLKKDYSIKENKDRKNEDIVDLEIEKK